jgi:cytochrome P450
VTRPNVHLDHFSEEFAEDPWTVFADLRERCPVAYSETYGGFWVLSKYADVRAAAVDDETFCSGQSVTVPGKPPGARLSLPIEVDPPLANEYRRVLNPWFSPASAERMEPAVRRYTDELIDGFISSGACDLVADFTTPLPAMATLALLGLDPSEWETYAPPIHAKTFWRPERTKTPEFVEMYSKIHERVMAEMLARLEEPRDDMLSSLVRAEIGGRRLTLDELQDFVMLILHGGFDTTGSGIANALLWLEDHPVERDKLRGDPSLMPTAVEEFLRYQAPQPGLARVATRDVKVGGQTIRKGERLLLLWASANRDGAAFERPDDVVLDRTPNRHLTFGTGLHRCLGAPLASMEMRVALDAILQRLPDYRIDRSRIVRAETVGTVYGHYSIPMTFTPGRRLG